MPSLRSLQEVLDATPFAVVALAILICAFTAMVLVFLAAVLFARSDAPAQRLWLIIRGLRSNGGDSD